MAAPVRPGHVNLVREDIDQEGLEARIGAVFVADSDTDSDQDAAAVIPGVVPQGRCLRGRVQQAPGVENLQEIIDEALEAEAPPPENHDCCTVL